MSSYTFRNIPLAPRFWIFRGILVRWLLVSLSLSACDKFGMRAIDPVDEQAFRGPDSISLGTDGKYLLSWQLPGGQQEDLSALTYEIYMDKWSALPTDMQSVASGQAEAELGISLGARIATLPDAEAPVVRGTLLGSVRGSRTYTLDAKLLPKTFYAFQVRLKDAAGKRDSNQQVLIYSSDLNPLSFQGVSGLSLSQSGKLVLEWDTVSSLPAGITSSDVTYEVYMSETSQSLDEILNGAQVIDGTLALAASPQRIGTLVELDEAKLPSQTEALLATKKGGRSYEITQKLDPEMSYMFQVLARGPGQELGLSRRVVVYRDGSDKTPPVFAGLASAEAISDKKILLKWDAPPSNEAVRYFIYFDHTVTQPIASTTQTSFQVTNLTPATSYNFIVRAKDSAGNEDKNTIQQTATTLSYAVPDFAGLTSVTPVGGMEGLSTLRLSWPMAGGSVTGYRVYMATSAGAQDLTSPAAVNGAVLVNTSIGPYLEGQTTTTATVSGLAQGTSYYFVVRAFYQESSSKPLYSELNTLERSGGTNTIKAPTFAGISAAAAASGSQALNAVSVSWPSPGVDGVYDSFSIAYEAGSCAAGFSSSPSMLTISDASARSAQVTGLSPQTKYRFRVRTLYAAATLTDSNSACRETNTTPTAPVFSGVSSVSVAAGIAGFNTLNLTWAPVQGSFSHYLVEWSTLANFSSIGGSLAPITSASTSGASITDLPSKTMIYVRVKAVFSGAGLNLSAGESKVLSANTTPPATIGEGISSINVASGTQLVLNWTAPSNAGAVYSGFKLWKACTANATNDLMTAMNAAPYKTFSASTLSWQEFGLSSNVECCYQLRAYYEDGNYILGSASSTLAQCATPRLVAPSFAGISGAVAPVSANGFNQINVNWSPIASSDQGNFSCYQVSVSTTPNLSQWPSSCTTVDTSLRLSTTSSYNLTGLSPNTNYYVRVRAVNSSASALMSNGDSVVRTAVTTPKAPTGDSLSAATASGLASLSLSYTAPSLMPEVGGLVNNLLIYIYQGTDEQLAIYKQSMVTPALTGILNNAQMTLDSAPTGGAQIRVPQGSFLAGQNNTFTINGLTTGQQVCAQVTAVYWMPASLGSPAQFLQSNLSTIKCATPTAVAPAFAGVSGVTTPISALGFSQLDLTWTPIASADLGNFSRYEVNWATSANPSSWNSQTITDATVGSASITGLSPNTTYYVRVLAVNAKGTSPVASGDAVVQQAVTAPMAPTGDNLVSAISVGPSSIRVHYTAPQAAASTGGLYNNVFLWIYQGTSAQTSAYQSGLGTPVQMNIAATLSGGVVNLPSAPVAGSLVQVPSTAFTPGGSNSFTINGLNMNQQVCVRAMAVYWIEGQPVRYLRSQTPSTQCASPVFSAPSFAGVNAAVAPVSNLGFNQLNLSWSAISSSDLANFSCYQVAVVPAAAAPQWPNDCISVDASLRTASTSSYLVTGLAANTNYSVRVRVVHTESGLQVSNGDSTELSVITTPRVPNGDTFASNTASGVSNISLGYTPPSAMSEVGGLYNSVFIYLYQGNSSQLASYKQSILSNVSNLSFTGTLSNGAFTLNSAPTNGALIRVPANSLTAGQINNFVINGLTTGQAVCASMHAANWTSGNSSQFLQSSLSTVRCSTPTAVAPSFAGLSTVITPIATQGFTQLDLTWAPIASADLGNFSRYEVNWATSASPSSWNSQTITDATVGTASITGLSPDTTYYVRVLAVNAKGTTPIVSGDAVVLQGITTPKAPTGDVLVSASSAGPSSITLSYTAPSATPTTGGLYNNIFLWVYQGTAAQTEAYQTGFGTPVVMNFGGTLSGGLVTLTSAPTAGTLVQVPSSAFTPGGSNNFTINGLTLNQQVCVRAMAVYWVSGQSAQYLKSQTPSTQCATTTAVAPSFAGIGSTGRVDDARDFTQIVVNWGAIGTPCTRVDISVSTTANSPNFSTPAATATCSDRSKTVGGLVPHTEYFVQVRAVYAASGQTFVAGQDVELSHITSTRVPAGDGLVSATAIAVPKSLDSMNLVYAEATSGIWNKTYVWRASASTEEAARSTLLTKVVTKVDNSGPTSAPDLIINTKGQTTTSETNIAVASLYYCYIARSVFADGTYYKASENQTIRCDRASPGYTKSTFAGVSSGNVKGIFSNGQLKIELNFASPPVGSIEEYQIFTSSSSDINSFDFSSPLQIVNFGDATYDADPNDSKILVGIPSLSYRDSYLIVRSKFYGAPDADDQNTATAFVTALPGTTGYVFLSKDLTGLGYPMWMMAYEASWMAGGSQSGGDSVSTSESNLANCSYRFHFSQDPAHSSCGTKVISKKAASVSGSTPASSVDFAEAFYGCRNSSDTNNMVRLPTMSEWQRAHQWVATSYNGMWNTFSGVNPAVDCAVSGGTSLNTGARTACKNSYGIFDAAGNVKEWVDARMVQYNITTAAEQRFSYGPMIGRTLANGIDNLSYRFHTLDPGAGGLALAMGADVSTPSFADRKQYGVDVQNWIAPTTQNATTGFRCVAFPKTALPSMDALPLPAEPTYVAGDISGAASTWKIPENLYVKDTRPEDLVITVNGSSDAVAEGKVNIRWKPWTRSVCNATTCSSSDAGLTYKLYRFIEPTRRSERTAIPWAISGGTANPYATDKPLDPLARDASGALLFSSSSSDGKLVATVSNCWGGDPNRCIFEDSTSAYNGFSARKLYMYLLVVESSSGAKQLAGVQRYRSPYYAGDAAITGAASFRWEPRYRRASVMLVDEFHQQAQTSPQIMVHVPMDQSGLDHDFYIYKYEGSATTGSTLANFSSNPSQADASGNWLSNAAACNDKLSRLGGLDSTSCGNTSATGLIYQSKRDVAVQANIDQGGAWKACKNAGVYDDMGHAYYMSLPTDAEWLKAADWGDLNQDGTIDQNVYTANFNVNDLEGNGAQDNYVVRCHTDNNPPQPYTSNSSQTASCRSRYGAADMVGNVWEWTNGQIYEAVGNDNGVDGLWLGQTFQTISGASFGNRYDLLRGFSKSSNAPTVTNNGDFQWYASGLRGSVRGGGWDRGASVGRWAVDLGLAPAENYAVFGARCSR